MIKLEHSVKIFIPSNIQGRTDKKAQGLWVDKIGKAFSSIYGGASAYNVQGFWNGAGGLCKESVKVIESKSLPKKFKNQLSRPVVLELNRARYTGKATALIAGLKLKR